ncbi:nitrilase-related carbon-nitrogen hydrolase [Fibrella aquatilis]|uniref:CN hydrolase domain-containing protein n=1 Tax=Fibrella aquatilis TaxID=2817059 RepID=A0A939G1I2_9BACT|nr:nitrilase-related carbon-nitrogen hydrolase [Fibrella aquatilis]MBO0930151.1 hypothetical protein [Fibrella aquatilis]
MPAPVATRHRPLLFIVGLFFLYFSNGSHAWAVAPWVALPCLLLVTRTLRPWATYVLMAVSFGVVTQASLWHFATQDARQLLHYVPLAAGLLFGLPYALDTAAFGRKKPPGWQTLVFPLAYTCLEFAVGSLNPYGTMGMLPYSQLGFLALAQLASVTGIWGITFLLTWFGSVVAYEAAQYLAKGHLGQVGAVYLAFFGVVVLFGSWRLSQKNPPGGARVASLHVQDRAGLSRLWTLRQTNPAAFRVTSDSVIHQLLLATRQQAQAGAQVVVWSEVSPPIYAADEPRLLDSLKRLTRETGVMLVASPYVYETAPKKDQNKLWLIDPAGNLVFTHLKYGGNIIEGCEQGNGQLQAANTPLGKVSAVICWDGDFPHAMRQVSKLDAGLLLIPAADWQAIDPLHTMVAQFRGIENGCSVVRQTLSGRSVMADPYGRVITQMDHFATTRWFMQGQLPTQRIPTLYGLLGDWFAWLCVAGLALVVWLSYKIY